jgi:hypothetical protein
MRGRAASAQAQYLRKRDRVDEWRQRSVEQREQPWRIDDLTRHGANWLC